MEGSEGQLEVSKAQLKVSEGQLEGASQSEGQLEGSEGQLEGSPFYRTLSPTGAAAQKGYREDGRRIGIKEKRAERKRLTNYRMVMKNSDPR